MKIEFSDFKKENDSGNKIINNRISTLEIRLNQIENKIINNRISTLEIKLNQIEKNVDFFYENFEKKHNSKIDSLQNKDCIPIICNKKNNKSLNILVKINFPKINNFDQTEVILQALIDTGCSFTFMCKSVVPQHNCFRSNIITKT